MPLTIITDRADNGNEFLCLTCKHGNKRSGRLSELAVVCSHEKFDPRYGTEITFRVTQCDLYYPAVLSRAASKVLRGMLREASYIEISDETGRPVILSADKAKERGLWRQVEYDEND